MHTHDVSRIPENAIPLFIKGLEAKGYSKQEIAAKLESIGLFVQWAYDKDHLEYKRYQHLKDEIAKYSSKYTSPAVLHRPEDRSEAISSDWASPIQGRSPPSRAQSEFSSELGKDYRLKNWLCSFYAALPFVHPNSKPTNSAAHRPLLGPVEAWPRQKAHNEPITRVDTEKAVFNFRSPAFLIGTSMTLLLLSILTLGIYDRFFKTAQSSFAYPSVPTSPSTRMLSFQGRLTDSLGNPITTATNMRFRLYTASSGGSTLYDSGTCSISPDTAGVHNVLVGSDCGAGIASSVFTENAQVWMGVTVGTDAEMTPRQQIANVPYALNAETLQGLPVGAGVSNIPYINADGDLLMAAAGPQIGSTFASQTFLVTSANAITIQSAGSGDVTLTATQSGTIKFATGGSQHGIITNGGLIGFGTSGPDAKLDVLSTAGEQLRLTYSDGSQYTSFNTSSAGDLTIAPSGADLNLTGSLTTTGDVAVNGDDITSDGTSLKVEVAGTGTTGILQVGVGGAGSTTPDYFGLGVKSDTGDPAGGFEGAMYYNTSDNKFRCYQGAAWTDCISAATASPWTDSGTTTYLTDTTDEVVIGGASPLSSAKFSIDGDDDTIQTLIQGHSTQNANIFEVETSAAANLLTLNNSGNLAIEGTLSDISGNLAINDSTDITGGLTISGATQLGDASGDTVTANAAAWTFANDTTVALSGGVNGLNFDSNTLSIDATNNKIGIGTAAPDGKLHVTGAAVGKALAIFNETGDQDILVGSASGNTRFRVANDGTIYGGYLLDISNTAYGIDPAGTSNFGGYSLKVTGGALLAYDSGTVGIGDQTPDAKLNIQATTEQLRLDYDDSNYASFTVSSGGDLTIAPTGSDTNVTGNLAISGGTTLGDASGDTVTANAAAWTFANDTTVALTGGVNGLNFDSNTLSIDATNNRLGIGTAAPTSPVTITAGTGGTAIPILSVTQQDNASQPPIASFIGTSGGTITMTWSGMVRVNDTRGIDSASYTQSNVTFSGGSTIVQSQNSTILFKDYNSGAYSEWARFTNTGSFGVNTTGPDAKIDSLSTTGEQLRLTYADGTAYTGFTVASTGDITLDSSGGDINFANADVLNIGGSGTDVAYNAIGDSLAGAANVASDNDLYIEDDLEVDGTIFGSLEGTIDLNFTDGSVLFANSSGVISQDNSNFFWDDSSNELGLGDTTPDAFLDITGTTAQLRLSYETGDTNYTSFTVSSGGDLTIAPTGADTNITGNLAVSGNTGLGDAATDVVTVTGKEIINFDTAVIDQNALYVNAAQNTSTAGTLRGLNLSANYSATTGTQTGVNGLDFTVQASGNGGTVTTMKGISAWGIVGTGATVGTFKLADVANPTNSGTITALSGFSVDNLTSGTNNTLILAGTSSIPSGNWGIYNSSAYSNYLSGTTGIGTTGPDAKLDVLSTTEQLRLTYTDGSAYTAFTVSSGGDLTLDPTGGNIVADAHFNPNTHDTYDLGTDGSRWRDLYLGPDTLHVGTSTSDEGTLKYVTSTNVLTFTNNFGDTDFGSTSDGFNFTLGGGAGDDFLVDSTTLAVESDNDRVGIGTAAPDAAWLDIAAATTGKAQINLTTSGGTDVSAPGSGDLWWNGTNLYFYNGAINKDLLAAGSGGPWTDGGSYVYTTAGEVLNLGGVTAAAYHAISDSGTTSRSLATDDDLYVEGDFEVDTAFFSDGSTTIGDASGDTVTANAAAWTFANDTTVALTGGLNGLNIDSDTFSVDGANDRIGIGTAAPSAKTHVLATTEQMRLGYDVSNYASFTTSSGGDLTVDATGGQVLLADADTINIGGVSALAYNAIADSGGATSHGLASDDDLFVEGDTEVNGTLYADGETVLTTVSGAGLTDCDSATSILLWDSTSKQFSCGKDNNTIVLATWTEVNVVASLTDVQMDRPQPAYLSGSASEIYLPYAGNIVGISIAGSAARAGGSATFTVFKNDSTTGFTCVIDGTNTQYHKCTQASGTDTFAAGDYLDVRITTDLAWTPTTNEYAVEIWVEMDTGADVAELYNVKDASIRSADIVSIDPTLTDGVMKSTGKYDTNIIGVIATKPGVLLGMNDVPDIGSSRAVALTGRVPVKVTTENGPIHAGDSIAASSLPGIGMKSTQAARVVGRALSDWTDADPQKVGTVMMFVEPGYDSGYILTQVQDLINDAKNTLITETFTAKRIITETIQATSAHFETLIAQTLTADQATLTDAQIENLNATALKAQTIEAEKITTAELKTNALKADTLEAKDATISGTLVAGNIDAKNVRELRDRLEKLAADQSQTALSSEELDGQIEDIQGYIAELSEEETPENIADIATYQILDQQVPLDPGSTESVLGGTIETAHIETLTVTGQASMTTLAVADAFSAGEVFIKDNTVLSLNNELKLGALEKVTIMNGGVTITADGTITSKGEVIAEKGIRTNSIKPLESGDDVAVVLGDASFGIDNPDGTRVASISSSGSASFSDLALDTYNEATSSAVVIGARDNYRQTGLYVPAIKTNAAASGNGILPAGESHILIFNSKIGPKSVINLTPTSTTMNKSMYVDKVETCTGAEAENELCQPYFRVSLDQDIPVDATFNWLIIH
jgi:hypothetical protein